MTRIILFIIYLLSGVGFFVMYYEGLVPLKQGSVWLIGVIWFLLMTGFLVEVDK